MPLPRILAGRRRWLFGRLVANGVAQGVTAVATALVARYTFDTFIGATSADMFSLRDIAQVAAILAVTVAVAAWLRMMERLDAERLGQDYIVKVRLALFDRLSRLSPRAMQRRRKGSVMLRFIGDLTALRNWISLGLARLVVSAIATVLAVAALAFVDSVFALILAGVLGAGAAVSFALGREMHGAVSTARRRQSQLAANVNEKIGAMAVVQLFGQAERERRRVARQSGRLKAAMVGRARIAGALRASVEATSAIASAAVLLAGVFQVSAGQSTPGSVVAGLLIVGLLAPRLKELSRVYEYWTGARVSHEKIDAFLTLPTLVKESKDARRLKATAGRVTFEDAGISGALDGVSATAEPGSVVAIVGPNGAGKSTLLAMAARLIDPSRGRVLIDKQDLKAATLSSIRRAVGMVTPELPLLKGTIERNLRYRWRRAPAEAVQRVAERTGVDRLLAELPDGLQSRVAEGGANLSSGERQRIALARALLGDPKVLLLDETDAHLDPVAAEALDRVLASFGGTVLMATHRLDRVRSADQVWHVQNGRLVEAGPPDELLSQRGPTAALFQTGIRIAS